MGMEFADQGLGRLEESLGTCRSFRVHSYDSEPLELQIKSATCVKSNQPTNFETEEEELLLESGTNSGMPFNESRAWMGNRLVGLSMA